MLLRNDKQVALNRVESLCLESADGYGSATGRCDNTVLAALFEQAQRERLEFAAELAPHIRALGDLPSDPDPDRETVSQVVEGIRAYLSVDGDAVLLEQRLQADSELEEAARAALAQALPAETRGMLERILSAIAKTREGMLEIPD